MGTGHEWVSIKVEDRVIEVFVKEFGSEDLKLSNVGDPQLVVIIEGEFWNVVQIIKGVGDSDGAEVKEAKSEKKCIVNQFGCGCTRENWDGFWGVDPMWHEPQLPMKLKKDVGDGLLGLKNDPNMDVGSDSIRSYPFPHGFGPCMGQTHIHRDLVRVQNGNQCKGEVLTAVVVGEFKPAELSNICAAPVQEEVKEAGDKVSDEEKSDKTLYKINEGKLGEWRNRDEVDLEVGEGTGVIGLESGGVNEVVKVVREDIHAIWNDFVPYLNADVIDDNMLRGGETACDEAPGVRMLGVCDDAHGENDKILDGGMI
ncbi:hypothetical protein PIB30_103307 [Stylosanthes scabra]|uniref:Uncharacterized protein n=1 Tax=Stylosanthes scabra TaxID=79078 RepID=A0ABU6QXE0_9FABA|nr:hypothetical protein [Stylosanthes scabra]